METVDLHARWSPFPRCMYCGWMPNLEQDLTPSEHLHVEIGHFVQNNAAGGREGGHCLKVDDTTNYALLVKVFGEADAAAIYASEQRREGREQNNG